MRTKNVLFPAAKTFPVAALSLATGYSLQALRASKQGTMSGLFKRAARIPHPE